MKWIDRLLRRSRYPSEDGCPYCPDARKNCGNIDHWKEATDYWYAVSQSQMERAEEAEARLPTKGDTNAE